MTADAWSGAELRLEEGDCPTCGRDVCEGHDAPPAETAPRFQRASETIAAPAPVEIVEGVAVAGCLSVVVSESTTGKTFLLLDVGAAVADGVSWHGRSVRRGSVAYVAYEGDALGLRLSALQQAGGRRLDGLYTLRASDPLSPILDRNRGENASPGEESLAAALDHLAASLATERQPPIVLLIIDTIRASLAGSEDNSEHVSAYLRAVRRILSRIPGAAAILAHHSGWQDGETKRKRERGSSAFRGNVDATLYLEADGEDSGDARLVLKTLKLRDAERPAPLHLIRRRVELREFGPKGFPLTSCIIEPDRRTLAELEAERVRAVENENRVIDLAILGVLRDHPEATSQKTIRAWAGTNAGAVGESLGRIIRAGWAKPPERQRHPYTLTDRGRAALEEAP